MPLKYLSNFWRSLEMTLINWKVQLKLRWTKHGILYVFGVSNADNDDGFLTIKKQTKIRHTFTNKMSTDIKLSKAQLSKIIQSGRLLGKTLGNEIGSLGKKALLELAVPPSVLDKFERKIGQGAVRAGK